MRMPAPDEPKPEPVRDTYRLDLPLNPPYPTSRQLGTNARSQRTVTPVQRSNGVSPNPNPRGVEGRDLLLWQGQRQARAKVDTHPFGLTRRPVVPRVVPVV